MIVCGMSGGVDSSVSALLLKERGEKVTGIFMDNWQDDDPACRANMDRLDALRVCASLNIPFRVRNFAETYRNQVFRLFLEGYAAGRTPNPDILCNREVKFQVFLEDALSLGADRIATGHYVRKGRRAGRSLLLRGLDPGKDQSYFLSSVDGRALDRCEFPVGELPKATVRAIADAARLSTATKRDSTGICFIGERDFRSFLAQYIAAIPGPMVDRSGRHLGNHAGVAAFTIGQRAPVGGIKGAPEGPWFVAEKRIADNTLVLVAGRDHPDLFGRAASTAPVSWISGAAPSSTFRAEVQVRHLGQAHPALVKIDQDGASHILFDHPVRALAPGQQAAFYDGPVCLGGAEIL